ncbi:MAG TPA: EamA family transporter [Thermoanaerobaculia bacterium]|jgi:drug/metabolite transporter (DMT)-like permease|nr:EamA family transporter [Thermoanaerobaculia bacterium]
MQTARKMISVDPAESGSDVVLFPSSPKHESLVGAYLAFAAICIIWGTTFVAIRVVIETIPTLLVTGIRFSIAGVLLLGIAVISKAKFPRSTAEWWHQALAGIVMAGVGNALVVFAEHSLTSGIAALLAATIPIWMAIMQALLGETPLTIRGIAGLALGFGGVGLLVAPAIGSPSVSAGFFLAVLAMQLSAIAWNAGTLYSRRQVAHSDPLARSVIQMLSAGLAVTLLALITGERTTVAMFTARSTTALLYLAIFGSVIAYWAYNYAQTKLSAGKVSSYAYVNPAVAVLFGALLLGEPVTLSMIAAMIVILAGVALIQFHRA